MRDALLENRARRTLELEVALCNAITERQVRECAGRCAVGREEHIDWLETQLGLVDQMGLQNWLQSQAGSPS